VSKLKRIIGGILLTAGILAFVGWVSSSILNAFTEVLKIPEWPLNPLRVVWLPVSLGIMIAIVALLGIIALCALWSILSSWR
jgi:lipopolysaccharide export LptBFGC system permease protein LptF